MHICQSVPALQPLMKILDLENSFAIEVDGVIQLSGWTALDLETGKVPDAPFEVHANLAIDIVEMVLKSMGLSLDNIVKVNGYLADPANFSVWNTVFKQRFNTPFPCRTTVGADLVMGEIEIDIVAARASRLSAAS